MKFYYSVNIDKDIDINFRDVYEMQHALFFDNEDFKDRDLVKDLLFDDFGDNLEYYLHKLGFIDFDESENEDISNIIWQEYDKWLDDNYNPSDFE